MIESVGDEDTVSFEGGVFNWINELFKLIISHCWLSIVILTSFRFLVIGNPDPEIFIVWPPFKLPYK